MHAGAMSHSAWHPGVGRRCHALVARGVTLTGAACCAALRRGQKVCLQRDEVLEELAVDELRLRYVQMEGAFSQPNAGMCQHMLSFARSATGTHARTLARCHHRVLWCGVGFRVCCAPALW